MSKLDNLLQYLHLLGIWLCFGFGFLIDMDKFEELRLSVIAWVTDSSTKGYIRTTTDFMYHLLVQRQMNPLEWDNFNGVSELVYGMRWQTHIYILLSMLPPACGEPSCHDSLCSDPALYQHCLSSQQSSPLSLVNDALLWLVEMIHLFTMY